MGVSDLTFDRLSVSAAFGPRKLLWSCSLRRMAIATKAFSALVVFVGLGKERFVLGRLAFGVRRGVQVGYLAREVSYYVVIHVSAMRSEGTPSPATLLLARSFSRI